VKPSRRYIRINKTMIWVNAAFALWNTAHLLGQGFSIWRAVIVCVSVGAIMLGFKGWRMALETYEWQVRRYHSGETFALTPGELRRVQRKVDRQTARAARKYLRQRHG
jgi:hypothetical protein